MLLKLIARDCARFWLRRSAGPRPAELSLAQSLPAPASGNADPLILLSSGCSPASYTSKMQPTWAHCGQFERNNSHNNNQFKGRESSSK